MDQVYEILIHKVHDCEGTVNVMDGDGVLALFGALIALEDAPQRALRFAYSIHREMAKLSNRFKQDRENLPPLKISKETNNYFSMWSALWFTALGCYYENEVEKSIASCL
jgi:hypothetical protein